MRLTARNGGGGARLDFLFIVYVVERGALLDLLSSRIRHATATNPPPHPPPYPIANTTKTTFSGGAS